MHAILANTTVSKEITLLNRVVLRVVLGNLLVLPVDGSILYFRPLYVQGSRNSFPVLTEVIAVYGGQGSSSVYMEPTITQALSDVFGTTTTTTPSSPTGSQPPSQTQPLSSEARTLIAKADALAQKAKADLRDENLGQYEVDVNQLTMVIGELQQLEAKSKNNVSTKTAVPKTKTTSPTSSTSSSSTSTTTSLHVHDGSRDDKQLDCDAIVEHTACGLDGTILVGSTGSVVGMSHAWERVVISRISPRGGAVW